MNFRPYIVPVGLIVVISLVAFGLYQIRSGKKPVPLSTPTPIAQSDSSPSPISNSSVPSSELLPASTPTTYSTPLLRDQIGDEAILQFRNHDELERFLALARKNGAEVLGIVNGLNAVRLRLKHQNQWDAEFEKRVSEARSSPNYRVRLPDPTPGNGLESAVDAHYVPFKNQTLAWLGINQNQNWGHDILIAVLDTGIENHPSLAGRSITRLDLLGEDAPVEGDAAGHGTAVAALIAGNSDPVHGVAPGASLLDVRVLSGSGVGDTFTLAQGIIDATDHGAKIISMSLGSFGDSPVLLQAVQYAQQRGVILVASSGNDSAQSLSYPAAYAGVVSVGGVDARGVHLPFSNEGDPLTLTAPGYGIYTAGSDQSLISFSGTSASAPLVSAAIAGVMTVHPEMTAGQALQSIVQSADDRGAPGPDPVYGAGNLNLQRVLEASQSGIYDIAVSDFYLTDETTSGGSGTLHILLQNRGTEILTSVQLHVTWNQQQQDFYLQSILPGQSVTQQLPIYATAYQTDKTVSITATASIPGYTDVRPENNTRIGTITFK